MLVSMRVLRILGGPLTFARPPDPSIVDRDERTVSNACGETVCVLTLA
jgi:hypothetical protein